MCPAYCLMPDHLHFVWMGLRLSADQLNGVAFLRTYLNPALAPASFQHQPHDHVLKESERKRNAFAKVCHYILENPARAELMRPGEVWAFGGSLVPGYPKLDPRAEGFWPKLWKLYAAAKAPDAGDIVRPPI